jgi:anti-sigma B factor antagonist
MSGLGIVSGHQGSGPHAGSTLVKLDGDLGVATAQAMRECLIGVLRPGIKLLGLDLSDVRSCDPAGLAVLVGTQRRARERGIVMYLVAPSPSVAEILRCTGLERCFTICPSLPDVHVRTSGEPAGAPVIPESLAG